MKVGDLVKLRQQQGQFGILIKRSYLAYDPHYSRWIVMLSDELRDIKEVRLARVKEEQACNL